jgi:hypothetical protein
MRLEIDTAARAFRFHGRAIRKWRREAWNQVVRESVRGDSTVRKPSQHQHPVRAFFCIDSFLF